jgi:LacI family transcriptional regulator
MSGKVDRALARGISKYSKIYGPWHFYIVEDTETETLDKISDWKIDGIIAHSTSTKMINTIKQSRLPAVVRGNHLKEAPHISSNHNAIIKAGVDYFLSKGFSNLAYAGYKNENWSKVRRRKFIEISDAMNKKVSYFETESIVPTPQALEDQYNWIKKLSKPTAILACNDNKAREVIEACKSENINIPEEIAVLGIDNDDYVCELSEPTISSIELGFEKAGFLAAQCLNDLINGISNETKIIIEPVEVIERGSTETIAIEDKDVADAVTFIKNNVKELISAQDVVNASYYSRRMLEIKFKKAINTTIQEEIDKRKMQEFAKLLRNSNLTIDQISKMIKLPNPQHVAQKFKKYFNSTPLNYRNSNRM